MAEVSDPEVWMEVHHEAEDERFHRYMVSERHDVSDVELWDEQQNQMEEENEEIARGEVTDDGDL
jgi:mRNA degradation ribonuclease J1/J2